MVQGLSSQGSVGEVCRKNPGDRTCCVAGVGPLCPLVWVPCVPWCGLLIRTWACYSEPGQPRPHAEQAARVWDSRLMCGTGRPRVGGGGPTPGSPHRVRTRYAESGPSCPHVGLLFRAWATPPAYGTGGPRAGQVVRVRDGRLMCGTGRPRVGGGGPTPGSPHRARTRYAEPGPSHPHVDPLFRAWATPPTCGIGGPRAGQVVRVRDAREPESLSHAANP